MMRNVELGRLTIRSAHYFLRKLCGASLRSIMPVNDSAELLFPFGFALFGRSKIHIKNVVINVNSLMRSLIIIVGKPFSIDVIQTLLFCLPDIAFTVRIRHWSADAPLWPVAFTNEWIEKYEKNYC